MSDIKALKDSFPSRKPNKLIKIDGGNGQRRKYGINVEDTWQLDKYLALMLANAIRIFASETHGTEDLDELELMAAKFEFYAMDTGEIIYENIDWSNDNPDESLLEYINAKDTSAWPGMTEYSEKSTIVDYWQRKYGQEAMEWLAQHWQELWD